MGKREDYNKCMRPYITGSKPKEQRKMDFCIGAKVCSSKAKDEAEAKKLCSLPKELKPTKITARRSRKPESCEKNVRKVAECVVSRLVENNIYRDQALNVNSVGAAVTNAMVECQCPK